ncbi:MAG TPA: hypothetical protein VIE65_16975 [Methylobacter sp.]|jgi:predicted ATP-grasp superfamily ATP-dependent carboligase
MNNMFQAATARKKWLETIPQEELDAFEPLSEHEIIRALNQGERDKQAADSIFRARIYRL